MGSYLHSHEEPRDLFITIRDTKEIFHAKIGRIKERPRQRLPFCFQPILHPGWVPVSQRLSVSPPAHRRCCRHGLLGMSSDIGGTRPGKYGSPCLRQAVPPATIGSSFYRPAIRPRLMPTHSLFIFTVLGCVCVSISVLPL